MPRPRKDWCPHGHHKPTVGYNGRACAECARRSAREYQKRRRAALYGGTPELYGGERQPLHNLRDLRLSLGLSQKQLARLAGMEQATISKLELGQTNGYPSTRAKLLEALGPLLERQRKAGL